MPVITENGSLKPRLIILRGSPAVGKSTVASKIASLNSAKKKTHLVIDDFQLFDMRTPCKDKEKLAIKNASLIAKNLLLEGFDVVAEYVFNEPEDLNYFLDFIDSDILGKVDEYYLQQYYLDAPIDKVIKRNQSRSGKRGEYMNVPLLRELYSETEKTKGVFKNEMIFDTIPYSAKQIARIILSDTKAYKNGNVSVIINLPEKDLQRALGSDNE